MLLCHFLEFLVVFWINKKPTTWWRTKIQINRLKAMSFLMNRSENTLCLNVKLRRWQPWVFQIITRRYQVIFAWASKWLWNRCINLQPPIPIKKIYILKERTRLIFLSGYKVFTYHVLFDVLLSLLQIVSNIDFMSIPSLFMANLPSSYWKDRAITIFQVYFLEQNRLMKVVCCSLLDFHSLILKIQISQ